LSVETGYSTSHAIGPTRVGQIPNSCWPSSRRDKKDINGGESGRKKSAEAITSRIRLRGKSDNRSDSHENIRNSGFWKRVPSMPGSRRVKLPVTIRPYSGCPKAGGGRRGKREGWKNMKWETNKRNKIDLQQRGAATLRKGITTPPRIPRVRNSGRGGQYSNTKIPNGNRHAHTCARLYDRGSDNDPRLGSLHLR
jgi:hypothetical protein